MRYNYYDYSSLIQNGDNFYYHPGDITFEKYYEYYCDFVTYAKRNELNINEAFVSREFYDKYKFEHIVLNEGVIQNIKDTVTKKIGETVDKAADINAKIFDFLKQLNVSPKDVTKETLKLMFQYVSSGLKNWYKIFGLLNTAKSKIVSGAVNTLKFIVSDILQINSENINKVEILKKISDSEIIAKLKEYVNRPGIRIVVGGVIALLILYMWTQSSFTGIAIYDFNVEIYARLLSNEDLFSFMTSNVFAEIIFFYVLNLTAMAASLPVWLGMTYKNLMIVGVLLFINFLILHGHKIIPDKIKMAICQYLNSKKIDPIPALNKFQEIGKSIGIISVSSVNANFCQK